MRLDKMLSHMGYGSRKEIKQLLKSGLVTVNGSIQRDGKKHIDIEQDRVMFKAEEIVYQTMIYYLLNKPAGVITATEDEHQETVLDLIDKEIRKKDLFPVGRLDKDTEGLLLITNDGQLAHQLLSPKRHVPKTYLAYVEGEVTASDIDAFKSGIQLEDGYQTIPADARIIKQGKVSEVEIMIYEGKYHQIKRMFAARKHHVCYLKRIKMGPLTLDTSLMPGQYRSLSAQEVEALWTYNHNASK
jgi:16S rRNA pseudouridine516 synthase